MEERAKGNEAVIHEWFQSTWRNVRNPMPPSIRSLSHGKQVFTTNCIGCHGLTGDGKGPATYFISNPAPRNFTDASVQLYFSDGELYDAILFGVDGTAMPSWGDTLTVNDIWDTVNFIRTIPNGGLARDDLDPSMMISPPDVRPIDATPLPPANIPGNIPVVTPEGGQGETSDATPAVGPTNATAVPTARSETGPGSGAPPQPGASPATGLPTALP